MAKRRLTIRVSLEDEEDFRDVVTVQRVYEDSNLNALRGGPRAYLEADVWDMYSQIKAAERVRHHG